MCFWPVRARAGSYLSVTHSAHILTSYVIYYWTDTRQHGMYLLNVITKQTTTDKAKASLCPLWRTRKKPFDVIYYLYKLKQYHWFLCVVAWIMIGPGKSRHWWKTCKTKRGIILFNSKLIADCIGLEASASYWFDLWSKLTCSQVFKLEC